MGIVAFSIGSLHFYWYGLVWMVSMLLGLFLTALQLKWRRENFRTVVDMLLWGLPVALVFARAAYVFLHRELYRDEFWAAFKIWQGGFSIYGALAGMILTVFLYAMYNGLDPWYWLDLMVPAILIGMVMNQLGNFVAQTVVGMPMPPDLPNDHTLAEYIEFRYRPSGFENYEYFKPVALYHAALQLIVFLFVCVAAYRRRYREAVLAPAGMLFLWSMTALAVIRFFCGFFYLTTDKTGGLHTGQLICIGAIVFLGLLLFQRWRRRARQGHRLFV